MRLHTQDMERINAMKKSLVLGGLAAIFVASASFGAHAASFGDASFASLQPTASPGSLRNGTNPGSQNRVTRPRSAGSCRAVRLPGTKRVVLRCSGPVYR